MLVNESESMDASQHCAHKVSLQQVPSLAVKPSNMCIKIVFVFISVILFVFIVVFVFVSRVLDKESNDLKVLAYMFK